MPDKYGKPEMFLFTLIHQTMHAFKGSSFNNALSGNLNNDLSFAVFGNENEGITIY